jgi:hypothetical protein
MSLHCKKELAVFPSPAGMSLIKLFLGGNNLVFFPPRESLVSFTVYTEMPNVHPFADIAPHYPLQLTEVRLKYLLIPLLVFLLLFLGGRRMPVLAEGVDEWGKSANRWASLDIRVVGGWRKDGGKVKFVEMLISSAIC